MSMTVELPDELARRLAAEAERRGVSVDELAVETLDEHFKTAPHASEISAKRHLAFAGIGASSSGRTARDADEILADGFGRD